MPPVFIIGPPGAGKSTISRSAAEKLGWAHKTIDQWTPGRRELSDAEVDVALARLFVDVGASNELVEFCHHDYQSLFAVPANAHLRPRRKLLVFAPLEVCLARNSARLSPVAQTYLERSWRSSEALSQSPSHLEGLCILDTGSMSVDVAIARMIQWVRSSRGGGNAG